MLEFFNILNEIVMKIVIMIMWLVSLKDLIDSFLNSLNYFQTEITANAKLFLKSLQKDFSYLKQNLCFDKFFSLICQSVLTNYLSSVSKAKLKVITKAFSSRQVLSLRYCLSHLW